VSPARASTLVQNSTLLLRQKLLVKPPVRVLVQTLPLARRPWRSARPNRLQPPRSEFAERPHGPLSGVLAPIEAALAPRSSSVFVRTLARPPLDALATPAGVRHAAHAGSRVH
jgi:hypothetical protein